MICENYEEYKSYDLKDMCKQRGITGYSKKTKEQLIQLLKDDDEKKDDNKEKYKVQPQVLYDAYKDYCKSNNIREANINKFGIFISNKFGKNKQIRLNGKHVRFYFGIELLKNL